ncbi:uncharacterized protein TM35_001281000 [Trypanosoma theileri]|uniref:Uncharacterized protein n=1 Tax=Trypanosoma theileri TaxID=67003 RepID=A0A1X0NDI0_9TRYP|nr:uncharacterized protein TM35_001281000 [Trypanosoma theileri]ORC81144.1 hypothetical protein TM35_001281000 [Trypanosoma theileri]
MRVRPAAESEWLTCGAGSRVSACGKYADLCRQRTARTAATTTTIATTTTVNAGQPKAVMALYGEDFPYVLGGFGGYNRKTVSRSATGCRGSPERGDITHTVPDHGLEAKVRTNVSIYLDEKAAYPSPEVKSTEEAVSLGQGAAGAELLGTPQVDSHVEVGGSESERKGSAPEGSPPSPDVPEHEPDNGAIATPNQTHGSNALPRGDQKVVNLGQQQPQITSSLVQEDGTQHGSGAVSSSVISAPQVERSTSTNGGGHSAGEHTETQQSNPLTQGNPESSNNTGDKTVPGDNNTTQQSSTPVVDTPAATELRETNSTTPPSTENTTTEAPTTTPSPVPAPNAEISSTLTEAPSTNSTIPSLVPNAEISNITSTVLKTKANVDSSIGPVWMRTAAPLLIVAVLFSVTVY